MNRLQLTTAKQEQEIDTLRFDNRALKAENAEIKRDFEELTAALGEDDAAARKNHEDRAAVLVLHREVKTLKQDLLIDRDKLRLAEEANSRWQDTLRVKQEEIDRELKERVERIVEKERYDHENAIKKLERELFVQASSSTELLLTNERLEKDLCACRIELASATK